MKPFSKSTWIWLGAALLVVLIALVGWYARFRVTRAPVENGEATTTAQIFAMGQRQVSVDIHERLLKENASYAKAESLRDAGKYADAAKAYKEALSQTSVLVDRTEIQFWLAYCDSVIGNYKEAIGIYKDIEAASSTLSVVVRAYAVQDMGHLYYRFGDPAITQEIFKDGPYKQLYVDGSVGRSYRNLFNYSNHLYPLALASLFSADWYANHLLVATTTTEQDRAGYLSIIEAKLRVADQDLATMQGNSDFDNTYVNALEKRASVLGKLERLGEKSYGDADDAFKQLLAYEEQHTLVDGTTRLQYAYYLADAYGQERASDITNVLAPIVAQPEAHGVVIRSLLKRSKDNWLGARDNFKRLGSLDPAFKQLLITSYGWKSSDF